MNENGTTIWIDWKTKNDLQKVAEQHGRTLVGQLRLMVKKELAEIVAQPAEVSEPAEQA